ncbi:conserved domain protein (plasmid) [Bacillus anthracis str. A0488]|nr:conserved domain protein [Bacillus anthracis str. CDC 684]EDR16420.1 conserved domain protein [Bacillus anthracis str. A0488]
MDIFRKNEKSVLWVNMVNLISSRGNCYIEVITYCDELAV